MAYGSSLPSHDVSYCEAGEGVRRAGSRDKLWRALLFPAAELAREGDRGRRSPRQVVEGVLSLPRPTKLAREIDESATCVGFGMVSHPNTSPATVLERVFASHTECAKGAKSLPLEKDMKSDASLLTHGRRQQR